VTSTTVWSTRGAAFPEFVADGEEGDLPLHSRLTTSGDEIEFPGPP